MARKEIFLKTALKRRTILVIRFPESSCVIGLATGPVAANFSLRRLKPATTNGFTRMRIKPCRNFFDPPNASNCGEYGNDCRPGCYCKDPTVDGGEYFRLRIWQQT